MTREIVLRIPEQRAIEILVALGICAPAVTPFPSYSAQLEYLRDLLQRAVDEAADQRRRQEID